MLVNSGLNDDHDIDDSAGMVTLVAFGGNDRKSTLCESADRATRQKNCVDFGTHISARSFTPKVASNLFAGRPPSAHPFRL